MSFLSCMNEKGEAALSEVAEAFAWCERLTIITIPESVTSIGYEAFGRCKSLTIKGKKGSYAETYAKYNRITFHAI